MCINFQKPKFKGTKTVILAVFETLKFPKNRFHVKSEWQIYLKFQHCDSRIFDYLEQSEEVLEIVLQLRFYVKSSTSKTTILTILKALKVDFGLFLLILGFEIYQKSNYNSLQLMKMPGFRL